MTPPYLEWIERESAAFAAAITDDSLERPVLSCPGWDQWTLAGHLGNVQRFWALDVRAGGEIPDDPPDLDVREPSAVRAWFDACTHELLDALRAVPWETAVWTWWKENQTVGAIARHQAGEAAVHRWDAQSAINAQQPLPAELADDGVDEFMWLARQFRENALPVAMHATDTGNTYKTGALPVATASAKASDLFLLLYCRVGLETVEVEGDRRALEAFLEPVD